MAVGGLRCIAKVIGIAQGRLGARSPFARGSFLGDSGHGRAGVVAQRLGREPTRSGRLGSLRCDLTALAFRVMLTCNADRIRARAARQDDSAMVILVIILLAITMSFVAIAGLLGEAKAAPHRVLNLGLAAATIILSWTVTQVVFTLHYAHEYYRPSGGPRAFAEGLDFRGDRTPDYWDFFYFATSFGAASQTSDVSILTKSLRRLATLHAIISFFFNTAVLALTINLAASMI